MQRPAAVTLMLLSIGLLAATVWLSTPYAQNDLAQSAISFLGPVAALIAGFILMRHSPTRVKWVGTKWGLFAGAFLFVILQAFIVGFHWEEILNDGVAYWVFVNLTSLYLGLPFCLAGGLIGWITDAIKNKRPNQSVDTTPDSRSAPSGRVSL